MTANLDGAVVHGWKVGRLEYDSKTVFPNGQTYDCAKPPCPLK